MLVPAEWLLWAERGAIGVYRKVGSPIAARFTNCRYQPSCSSYALHSLEEYGFWQGNLFIAKRLSLCSPIGWALEHYRDEPYYTRRVKTKPEQPSSE